MIAQAVLSLAFLPYEAFFCLDAIVRTIGRMLITRRRLLEWNTSSEVDRALERLDRTDLFASYRVDGGRPSNRRRCVDRPVFHQSRRRWP